MATGPKILVENTRERVVSADIVRLQKLAAQERAEFWRYIGDVTADDEEATGVITEPSVVETPLRAEILNGLLVRPQDATFDLFVDPGVVALLAPDAVADESNSKIVRDPGIQALGALVIAANATGSVRIDVIECQGDAVTTDTTEARDIFDNGTNLYVSTVVTKTQQAKLTYRVRQGVAGSGMPANASGWLPLCVARVPSGALTNADITFWDVRPLVSGRARQPFNLSRVTSEYTENWAQINDRDFVGEVRMSGKFHGSVNGQRTGGWLKRTTPGADNAYIDLLQHLSSAYTIPVGPALAYVYIGFLRGLPRWSMYAPSPAARVPRNPLGMIVVSDIAPENNGRNSAQIDPPTASDLVVKFPARSMQCIATLIVDTTSLRGGISDGRVQWARNGLVAPPAVSGLKKAADGGATLTQCTFTLTPGTEFPAHAKAIYVAANLNVDTAAGVTANIHSGEIEVLSLAGTTLAAIPGAVMTSHNSTAGPLTHLIGTGMMRIPLFPEYPASATTTARILRWNYKLVGIPLIITQEIAIYGWEF